MSDDLAAWLLEQIDEDERRATDVGAEGFAGAVLPGQGGRVPGPRWEAQDGIVADIRDQLPLWKVDGVPWAKYATSSFVAKHMATWDPKRALAECDAKRQIVAMYRNAVAARSTGSASDRNRIADEIAVDVLYSVMQIHAETYAAAGRPGYREEWRP